MTFFEVRRIEEWLRENSKLNSSALRVSPPAPPTASHHVHHRLDISCPCALASQASSKTQGDSRVRTRLDDPPHLTRAPHHQSRRPSLFQRGYIPHLQSNSPFPFCPTRENGVDASE